MISKSVLLKKKKHGFDSGGGPVQQLITQVVQHA